MANKEILDNEVSKQEFIASFAKAIICAGGSPTTFLKEDLTLGMMMDRLARNGVRFTHVKLQREE